MTIVGGKRATRAAMCSARGAAVGACLVACFGCGSTTRGVERDAGADAADAPADVSADAVDAQRCDPSVLDDAGTLPDAPPPDRPYVVELSITNHACARMSDGTVRCRGRNVYGQVGNGTAGLASEPPTEVAGLTDVVQVMASIESTCARLRDGTVRCWGSNRDGALGVGHAGDEECGSSESPTACRRRPTTVPGLTDVTHLASGPLAVCAVRGDGSVWCWGRTHFPVQTDVREYPTPIRMEGLRDVVWIRGLIAGWVVRYADGRHEALRWSFQPPPIPAGAVVAEGPFNEHFCYRLPDSSARCLGYNPNGKLGNGRSSYPEPVPEPVDPGLCGVRSITTGAFHTCAVLADRRVWCWGDTSSDDDDAVGPERCVGINRPTTCLTRPTLVEGIDQVDRLFANAWETCAIRADRSVWCWGSVAPVRAARPARLDW